MRNKMALLDLKTVRQAYEQNEYQATGALKKLYNKGVTVILLSPSRRSKRVEAWLKEKKLDQYNPVFPEDTIKYKFFAPLLRLIPVSWKQFFVRSLIDSMNAGEAPDADRVFFADTNPKSRKAVGKLKDKRLIVCDSLAATANKVF
jgi:hypothetical protein